MSEKLHDVFNISIVGSGNVAWHLAHAFALQKHRIHTIISRNTVTGKELAKKVNANYSNNFALDCSTSDVLFLAVDDSCLSKIIHKIQVEKTIVLHTSGSIALDIFSSRIQNYGVFYPFQTLTKGVKTDISVVPICIEASNNKTLAFIHELAETISTKVYALDSEKRKILHLSGALSNNFVNHLIALAFDYLQKNKIPKDLLFPLLKETFSKLEKASPREAQTGPARRNNTEIIDAHLKMLHDEPELKKLYRMISDSIIAYYS